MYIMYGLDTPSDKSLQLTLGDIYRPLTKNMDVKRSHWYHEQYFIGAKMAWR